MVHAAVSGVENPRRLAHHDLPVVGEAGHGQVLQGPVPVVVVIGAEGVGTLDELLVRLSAQSHPHVVLSGLPGLHLHLVSLAGVADVAVAAQRKDVAVVALLPLESRHQF